MTGVLHKGYYTTELPVPYKCVKRTLASQILHNTLITRTTMGRSIFLMFHEVAAWASRQLQDIPVLSLRCCQSQTTQKPTAPPPHTPPCRSMWLSLSWNWTKTAKSCYAGACYGQLIVYGFTDQFGVLLKNDFMQSYGKINNSYFWDAFSLFDESLIWLRDTTRKENKEWLMKKSKVTALFINMTGQYISWFLPLISHIDFNTFQSSHHSCRN